MKYGELLLRQVDGEFITPHGKALCKDAFEFDFEFKVPAKGNIIVSAYDRPRSGRRPINIVRSIRNYGTHAVILHGEDYNSLFGYENYYLTTFLIKDLHTFGIDYKKNTWFWISIRKA